jgi:hypothetical protein
MVLKEKRVKFLCFSSKRRKLLKLLSSIRSYLVTGESNDTISYLIGKLH